MSVADLWRDLAARPWAHDFYALLRRIERLHPKSPRFGTALRPSEEPLRFGQDPELDFAPAALQSFEMLERATPNGAVPRLGVRFFGLFGPQGPLPTHLTEHARDRLRHHDDGSFARFADLFHHRLIGLFYRAWAQSQPAVSLDRRSQRFGDYVDALAGLTPLRDAIHADSRRAHVALLARNVKNSEGLADILSTELGIEVEIRNHVGHWLPLDREDRARLGQSGPGLGDGVAIGDAVWDRQFKFRVRAGPMPAQRYAGFLPGGADARELRDWVRQYVGLDLVWDLQVVIDGRDVAGARLGQAIGLGYQAWLAPPDARDRDDLLFVPDSTAFTTEKP